MNDTVTHPDDSFLLAYIRQQPLENRWADIDLHLTQCPECMQRVKELQEISISLDTALLPSQNKLPQSQRESNWDWLENPEAAQHLYQHREHERLREDQLLGMALLTHLPQVFLTKVLPTVLQNVQYQRVETYQPGLRSKNPFQATNLLLVFAVMVVITTLFVFAMVRQPLTNIFHPTGATITAVPTVNSTIAPHAKPTPAGTASLSGGKTTAGITKPTINLCLTRADKNQHRMHICGVNFKPGDKVDVIIELVGNAPRILHPLVFVGDAGRFEDSWPLNGCRSVPIAIVVQDVAHPSIESQVLQNIQYNGCPNVVIGHR